MHLRVRSIDLHKGTWENTNGEVRMWICLVCYASIMPDRQAEELCSQPVCSSIHPFIRLSLNLWTKCIRVFWKRTNPTHFDANWRKWSTDKSMTLSTSGVRRSMVKVWYGNGIVGFNVRPNRHIGHFGDDFTVRRPNQQRHSTEAVWLDNQLKGQSHQDQLIEMWRKGCNQKKILYILRPKNRNTWMIEN